MDWVELVISEWALLYLYAQLIIRLVSTVSTAYTWVVAITIGCSLDQPLLGPWRFQELGWRKLVWMTICWGCRIEWDIVILYVSRLEVFTFWDVCTTTRETYVMTTYLHLRYYNTKLCTIFCILGPRDVHRVFIASIRKIDDIVGISSGILIVHIDYITYCNF